MFRSENVLRAQRSTPRARAGSEIVGGNNGTTSRQERQRQAPHPEAELKMTYTELPSDEKSATDLEMQPVLKGQVYKRGTGLKLKWFAACVTVVVIFFHTHTQLLPLDKEACLSWKEWTLWSWTHHVPSEAKETFELRLPILYKNLVHEETLVEHSFGNSWGEPAKEWFTSPGSGIEFNRVTLQLNTTVDGVQYDRLAHVFIDDIPVWRTSTAEPGNQLIYTSVEKDVSKYLTLFQGRNTSVTLQLDNLIRGKLTGAFNTTLTIKYFNEPELSDDIFNHMTVTNNPANRVTKLVHAKPNRTPLLYYPNDPMEFSIPTISRNTTALKLALFISGNAEEEFWYSNSMESRKDYFAGHGIKLLGHGPVRIISVYVNNKLISVTAPEPVIFSGGISPALWRPIMGVNSMDVKALEIDLSGAIPEMWKTSAALDIIISNGTSTSSISVGQNWIAGASLLHWESDEIESCTGAIESINIPKSYFISYEDFKGPEEMQQQAVAGLSAEVQSNFKFTMKNGSEIPAHLHCKSDVTIAVSQEYFRYGDLQLISASVSSGHSTDLTIGELSAKVKSIKFYPLMISLETEPIVSPNITYVANVTNVYGSRILINDREVNILESYQNGTSEFTLSPRGNFGFGSTDQTFAADMRSPFPRFREDALAKAVNGTVIERDEKMWHHLPEEDDSSLGGSDIDISAGDVIGEHFQELVWTGAMSFETATKMMNQLKMYREELQIRLRQPAVSEDNVAHFPGFHALRNFYF